MAVMINKTQMTLATAVACLFVLVPSISWAVIVGETAQDAEIKADSNTAHINAIERTMSRVEAKQDAAIKTLDRIEQSQKKGTP